MTLTVYTPGHGLYTDTLIAHGIVAVARHAGVRGGVVERVGERYRITLEASGDEPVDPLTTLSYAMKACSIIVATTNGKASSGSRKGRKGSTKKKEEIVEAAYRPLAVALCPLSGIGDMNILKYGSLKIAGFIEGLTAPRKGRKGRRGARTPTLREVLEDYIGERGLFHVSEKGEGRSKSKGKGKVTLYLALAPFAGKSLHRYSKSGSGEVQKVERDAQYVACEKCVALAAAGLAKASIILPTGGVGGSTILVPAPVRADVRTMLLWHAAAEKWRIANPPVYDEMARLSALGKALLTLSYVEILPPSISGANGLDEYELLLVNIEGSGGRVRVTGYESVPPSFYRRLEALKEGMPSLYEIVRPPSLSPCPRRPEILQDLLDLYARLVEALAEYLAFGGEAYHVVRALSSYVDGAMARCPELAWRIVRASEGLIEALSSISSAPARLEGQIG